MVNACALLVNRTTPRSEFYIQLNSLHQRRSGKGKGEGVRARCYGNNGNRGTKPYHHYFPSIPSYLPFTLYPLPLPLSKRVVCYIQPETVLISCTRDR